MNSTKALRLFNIAKNVIEELRPWRILAAVDSTKTWTPSDTYTSMKALPASFRELDGRDAITLKSSNDSEIIPTPIPLKNRESKKDIGGYYYIKHSTNEIAFTGDADQTYTIHIGYIGFSAAIDDTDEWVFPARFHPILAYIAAAMEKGGINYDDVFAQMAPENRAQAQAIMASMIKWDDRLKRQELGL